MKAVGEQPTVITVSIIPRALGRALAAARPAQDTFTMRIIGYNAVFPQKALRLQWFTGRTIDRDFRPRNVCDVSDSSFLCLLWKLRGSPDEQDVEL
jgi:hypothetical protein